ncbi:WG repeat-containing protein [Myroides odoratus]
MKRILLFLLFSLGVQAQNASLDSICIEYKLEHGLFLVSQHNKYGLIDSLGNSIAPIIYDDMDKAKSWHFAYLPFEGTDYITVNKGGKIGLMDKTGKLIVPTAYEDIKIKSNLSVIITKSEEGMRLLDLEGKPLSLFYDWMDFSGTYIVVRKKDKYGYVNPRGKITLPICYDKAMDFRSYDIHTQDYAITTLGDKKGFIHKSGSVVVPPIYDEIELDFRTPYIRIRLDGKYGVIDRAGTILVSPDYEEMELNFEQGYALIYQYRDSLPKAFENRLYGAVNFQNKQTLAPIYNQIFHSPTSHKDLAKIYTKTGVGLANPKTGQILAPPIFMTIEDEYLDEYGIAILIQAREKNISREYYSELQRNYYAHKNPGPNNLISLLKNPEAYQYGAVDREGNILVPSTYQHVELIRGYGYEYPVTFFKAQTYDNKEVAYDLKGKQVVAAKYDKVQPLYKGMDKQLGYVIVKQNNQFGLINSKGKILIPITYDYITQTPSGLLQVKKDNKKGLMNLKGKIVLPLRYDQIENDWYQSDLIKIEQDNTYGMLKVNRTAQTVQHIIPVDYSSIAIAIHKEKNELLFFIVKKDQHYGLYSPQGTLVCPPIYDNITDYNGGKYALVYKDNQVGLLKMDGTFAFPLQAYTNFSYSQANGTWTLSIDENKITILEE